MLHALFDCFPDVVFHAAVVATSGNGSAAFGPETEYKARIARKQRTVVSKSGAIAVSRAQVWIGVPNVVVNLGDQLRLPDGVLPSGNTTHAILAVESFPDEDGTQYVKVYL